MQSVSVTTGAGGTQAGTVQTVTPAQAAQAASGLEAGKPHTGEAEGSKAAQVQAQVAAALMTALVEATAGGTTTQTSEGKTQTAQADQGQTTTGTTSTTTTVTSLGAVPATITTSNALPTGPILSLNGVILALPAGTSLATFESGSPSLITPLTMGGGGVATVTAPLLQVTGETITHSGPIVPLTGSGVNRWVIRRYRDAPG